MDTTDLDARFLSRLMKTLNTGLSKAKKGKGEEKKMIFNVPGHIQMIRNGLDSRFTDEKGKSLIIVKTQTRRLNRGIYQVGKSYAVQRKRGVKAEPDIRIVMDRIWEEDVSKPNIFYTPITKENAWREGGYRPEQYEKVFRELNPKWDGWSRWAFKFHVVEVRI